MFTVFCYLWLPFMIIPVYAALERIPASQIEASQDLGGRTWRTTRLVLLPLALPGIITGIALNSFFSFTGIQLGTLTIVMLLTIIPVVLAARLAGAGAVTRSARNVPVGEPG